MSSHFDKYLWHEVLFTGLYATPIFLALLIGLKLATTQMRDEPRVAKLCMIAFGLMLVWPCCRFCQSAIILLGFGSPAIREGFSSISQLIRMARMYVIPFVETAAWILIVVAVAHKLQSPDRRGEKIEQFFTE